MKYSKSSLNLAIETILPHVKKAKNAGAPIDSSSPELLKDVAVAYFTSTLPFDPEKMACLSVARQAMKELHRKGAIEFGNKELSEELKEIHRRSSFGRPDALN